MYMRRIPAKNRVLIPMRECRIVGHRNYINRKTLLALLTIFHNLLTSVLPFSDFIALLNQPPVIDK